MEKLLKALYCLKGERPPKSHYIDDLGRGLGLGEIVINDLLELTGDYTFSRYPDIADLVPFEAYTMEIAKEKVSVARRIFDSAKAKTACLENEESPGK